VRKIFIIFLLVIFGCTNPFDTRDPEPPQTTKPSQPISTLQNDPDSLLKLLQLAFREPNWNYYNAILIDPARFGVDFVFIPQHDVAYRMQEWTRQDEINYFVQLTQNRKENELNLQIYNIEGPVQIGASLDTLQTQFSYQLEIAHINETEYYIGEAIFKMLRSSQSLWYVFHWEDRKGDDGKVDSTWSVLKINFR
jgi:hypothetical protein